MSAVPPRSWFWVLGLSAPLLVGRAQAQEPNRAPVYEPPPPPQPRDSGRPTLSIRVDPLSWLIWGDLPLELEAEVASRISVEVVPVFVTSENPPALEYSFHGDVTQHSNGLGSLAGASIGGGIWFTGKRLRGQVFKLILTNYAYRYQSSDQMGTIDEVSHTERRLFGYLGSSSVYGVFTLAGGFGLGVELNKHNRCFPENDLSSVTTDCKDQGLELALDRNAEERVNLYQFPYPIALMARISIGVTF
jgi:hypothetical protein